MQSEKIVFTPVSRGLQSFPATGRGRVSTDSDGHHTLIAWLRAVRQSAGEPSLRTIAANTAYSHTTVAKVLNGAMVPSWPVVRDIAVALDADVAHARRLWDGVASDGMDPPPDLDTSTPATPTSSWRVALAVWYLIAATAVSALAVMLAIDPDPGRTTAAADISALAFAVAAIIILATRAFWCRKNGHRSAATFFAIMTAAISGWLVGHVLWAFARTVRDEPVPLGHLHDVAYLWMPLFATVALWRSSRALGVGRPMGRIDNAATLLCMFCGIYLAALTLLTALGDGHADAWTNVYALRPSADILLAMLAFAPIVYGRRLTSSAVLSAAFLAAATSDTGYMILRADPDIEALPSASAVGHILFLALISTFALLARPVQEPFRSPRPISGLPMHPTTIASAVAAISLLVAVTCALWIRFHTEGPIQATATVLVVVAAAAFGLSYVARSFLEHAPLAERSPEVR